MKTWQAFSLVFFSGCKPSSSYSDHSFLSRFKCEKIRLGGKEEGEGCFSHQCKNAISGLFVNKVIGYIR